MRLFSFLAWILILLQNFRSQKHDSRGHVQNSRGHVGVSSRETRWRRQTVGNSFTCPAFFSKKKQNNDVPTEDFWQAPHFSICPPFIILKPTYYVSKEDEATVMWFEPVAIDTLGSKLSVVQVRGGASGTRFPGGVGGRRHDIVYLATDKQGLSANCYFSFTVKVMECAELATPSKGHLQCSNHTSVGSECNITCNAGYQLSGPSKVTCINNTEPAWTVLPHCEIMECVELATPSNGHLQCSNHTLLGSECNITCNAGYQLSGPSKVTCINNTEPAWTVLPHCEIIKCAELATPSNGHLQCSNHTSVGSECNITCNAGYQLSGPSKVTCINNTEPAWTGLPHCEIMECVELATPSNGHLQCSNHTLLGSECNITCNAGYQLSGPSKVTCINNTEPAWTVLPHCEKVACGPPPPVLHGSISCTDYTYQSFCRVSCDAGLIRQGSPFAICDAHGTWSVVTQPVCQESVCGPAPTVLHGYLDCQARLPPFYCIFSCEEGFTLNGTAMISCEANETWAILETPICKETVIGGTILACGALFWPSNGQLTCSLGRFLGSTCIFTCNEGYEVSDTTPITCQNESNPQWTSQPSCQKLSCGPPDALANGHVTCNDYVYGSYCTVACDIGYRITDNIVYRCEANKQWSGSATCRDDQGPELSCLTLQIFYADRGSLSASVTWREPTAVDRVDPNPSVIKTSTDIEQGVTVDAGNSKYVTYKAVDAEGNESPTCIIELRVQTISCGHPLDILLGINLRFNCSMATYTHGDTCTLDCILNLPLEGVENITCEREDIGDGAPRGRWDWGDGEQPYCKDASCRELDPPVNGALVRDTINGKLITVMMCSKAFDILPDMGYIYARWLCLDNGQWSPVSGAHDCLGTFSSRGFRLPTENFYYDGVCGENDDILENYKNVILWWIDDSPALCPTNNSCFVTNPQKTCGNINLRKRRADNSYTSECSLTVMETASHVQCSQDVGTVQQCIVQCKPGYILPGNLNRYMFRCGLATGSSWLPSPYIPDCVDAFTPQSMMLITEGMYTSNISQNLQHTFKDELLNNMKQTACFNHTKCVISVHILDDQAEGTSSRIEVHLVTILSERGHLEYAAYLTNGSATAQLQELIDLTTILESSAETIASNDGAIFDVNIRGQQFTTESGSLIVNRAVMCDTGMAPAGCFCGQCPPGSYYDGRGCSLCAKGTFQPHPGKSECISCKLAFTTPSAGASSPSHCSELETPLHVIGQTTQEDDTHTENNAIFIGAGIAALSVCTSAAVVVIVLYRKRRFKTRSPRTTEAANFQEHEHELELSFIGNSLPQQHTDRARRTYPDINDSDLNETDQAQNNTQHDTHDASLYAEISDLPSCSISDTDTIYEQCDGDYEKPRSQSDAIGQQDVHEHTGYLTPVGVSPDKMHDERYVRMGPTSQKDICADRVETGYLTLTISNDAKLATSLPEHEYTALSKKTTGSSSKI